MGADHLTVACLLSQLLSMVAEGSVDDWEPESVANCSNPMTVLTTCGRFSANGCCAKGCVRNHRGRCVQEQCMDSWSSWLKRPVTMSCYFHWFLLIFAGIITALMLALVACNVAYEVKRFMHRRSMARFRRFRDLSGGSVGSTQC
ncbi:uncharacterized protein [Drosophila bipectinata]|uniref:uncharacterized protein n=1 Tax=Drosophila bipectinata TaxID=42026 RepID=UPI001C89D643|nr:uncharacterized protein LOC108128033 [Drosophila bipectinata]KAH8267788.1 hypothetical protein KR026_006229 [Drosophila bipectinata]